MTRFRIPDRLLRVRASADGSAVYLSDNTNRLYAVDALSGERLWTVESPGGDAQWGMAAVDPRGRWLAVPLIGDPESMAMAVLDARTGEVRHQVMVEDLTGVEPETSPWVDESAHLLGRKVVLTTETHAFVIDPATGEVLRAMPFGPHAPYSWRLPDGRIACPDARARSGPASSILAPAPIGPAGVDRGGRRHRQPTRHLQGRDERGGGVLPPAP